jgi:hypothetical protein
VGGESLKKKVKNSHKSVENGKIAAKQIVSKQPTIEGEELDDNTNEMDVSFSRIPSINGANWAPATVRPPQKNIPGINAT